MNQWQASLEKTQYRGWNAYRLSNGLVSLYIAPDIGGRAIQLQLGDHDFLFVNAELAGQVLPQEQNNAQAGWANYGGDKVWPAPQGQFSDSEWPGPPDYIIEGSRFSSEIVADSAAEVAVRVTSPSDPRTGIQFVRTFHVFAGTTRIRVDQVMRNISQKKVRWGIWHVMQHDAADAADPSKPNPELFLYVPLSKENPPPHETYVLFGDARHPAFRILEAERMLRVHYTYRMGKIAANTDRGWIAVVNGQKETGFIENFDYSYGVPYPDNASVECWLNGPGLARFWHEDMVMADDPKKTPYLMESEILSPMAALRPGEEYSFAVDWLPTRVPNPVVDATQAGVVSEPLRASVSEGNVVLEGVFGVFSPGAAEAAFYSPAGEEIGREVLQSVDPREVFRLRKAVPLPPHAVRVSLIIRDSAGADRGILSGSAFSTL